MKPMMIRGFVGTRAVLGGIKRQYHSTDHTISNFIIDSSKPESKILSRAVEHIPKLGFSSQCITEAIRDLKYGDSAHSLLTSSNGGSTSLELQLAIHYLKVQRINLEKEVMNPDSEFHQIADEFDRVAFLINKRLKFNIPYIKQLPQALSQLAVPYNYSHSLDELHNLSDDVAFYAGDTLNDFAWYAKRGGFSGIYVASELFQLQDTSKGYQLTRQFVDDKVKTWLNLGDAYNNVEQWSYFNAISVVNLIKSQLLRG